MRKLMTVGLAGAAVVGGAWYLTTKYGGKIAPMIMSRVDVARAWINKKLSKEVKQVETV